MESAVSTDFKPQRRIFARDLFDGRLDEFSVREWGTPSQHQRALTDGRENYLVVQIDDNGSVHEFTRYAWCNDPNTILAAVAEAFQTDIYSEHEPQYWGCETHEEVEKYLKEISKRAARNMKFKAVRPGRPVRTR
jgi:hypothetical protein